MNWSKVNYNMLNLIQLYLLINIFYVNILKIKFNILTTIL